MQRTVNRTCGSMYRYVHDSEVMHSRKRIALSRRLFFLGLNPRFCGSLDTVLYEDLGLASTKTSRGWLGCTRRSKGLENNGCFDCGDQSSLFYIIQSKRKQDENVSRNETMKSLQYEWRAEVECWHRNLLCSSFWSVFIALVNKWVYSCRWQPQCTEKARGSQLQMRLGAVVCSCTKQGIRSCWRLGIGSITNLVQRQPITQHQTKV